MVPSIGDWIIVLGAVAFIAAMLTLAGVRR
jgi:hypothetical protein